MDRVDDGVSNFEVLCSRLFPQDFARMAGKISTPESARNLET